MSVSVSLSPRSTAFIDLLLILFDCEVNPSGVDPNTPPAPPIIQFLKRLSPFAFAIEGLCLGEYPGMRFKRGDWRNLPRMGGLAMVRNGEQVLDALGLAGKDFDTTMKNLGTLSVGYLAASWVGMYVNNRSHRSRRINRKLEAADRETQGQKYSSRQQRARFANRVQF